MALPTTMSYDFSATPGPDVQRSTFKRIAGYKTTLSTDYLYPFYCDLAMPGDTMNFNAAMFARMATPIAPLMDNIHMETFFFSVPIRLLWEHFENFMGDGSKGDLGTDFTLPKLHTVEGFKELSLDDYFGLPTKVKNLKNQHSLFHRAYNLIWNEWFRSEDLQKELIVNKGDGPDLDTDYKLLKRGKRYDYFTSALPKPQKGPDVFLPLGAFAPVVTRDIASVSGSHEPLHLLTSSGSVPTSSNLYTDSSGVMGHSDMGVGPGLGSIYPSNLWSDLSDATAVTINQIRQAFAIQRLQERDQRSGTRYTEILQGHFGVTPADARLQRPEYLGGGFTNVIINSVAQTSASNETSPQGNLAAFGIASASNHGFTHSFDEHCVVIGLVNFYGDITYQQGIDKKFLYDTRLDFPWPEFAHLGEQPVYNEEIYAQGTDEDKQVFGYVPRYDERRFMKSLVTGRMRSNSELPLDYWHLAAKFNNLPTLSGQFIESDTPMERIEAVPTEPDFICDFFLQNIHTQCLPAQGIPGLIDHF